MIYFSLIRRIEDNIENNSKKHRHNFCLAVSPIHSFLSHVLLIFSAENKRGDDVINMGHRLMNDFALWYFMPCAE